jgi:V/A-type H+-transporting ATPase subunit I
MQKIAVIGLDEQKESIMSKLMDFGCVELVDQKGKLADENLKSLVSVYDDTNTAAELDSKVNRAEMALRVLEEYDSAKEPLFFTRRAIGLKTFGNLKSEKEQTEKHISKVLELEDNLRDVQEQINQLTQDEILLTPWQAYGLPLELMETHKTTMLMGVLPALSDSEVIIADLQSNYKAVAKAINSDKDLIYLGVLCLESVKSDIEDLLKQHNFSEIPFDDFEGTVVENLKRIREERDALNGEAAKIKQEITQNVHLRKTIENYSDLITVEADKEKGKWKLLRTEKTFYLEGWIPAAMTTKADKLLAGMNCFYDFEEPKDDDEVPVILNNKNFFVPFEAITEMYSLPDYRGFDPTSLYALFYAIFFGMMLCDAGYGILMTVGCAVCLKKYHLEGTTFKMVKLMLYCGISTIFWGALFGSWFGNIVQVFSNTILHKEVIVKPLWFDPLNDPMKLLIFSLGLGIIHIFLGMGIKAYMQIREGKWFDAICDEGFWYFTIVGLLAWLGGASISEAIVPIGKWLTIIGAIGLLLTGGRHNKGIGKIIGGLGNLYNITGYMSDILSYARLLALGLASGVIAQVVNTMGSLFGGGLFGLIVLIIVFIFGHALNIAINALGAFIHSSRLQYVEFFGKFYEDGGEPFRPFCKKTKYIRIEQEEE